MPPVFYVGYYPGKKPIKRKYIPPESMDTGIFDEYVNAFNFDENINIDQRIKKELSSALENQFKVRFTAGNKSSQTAKTEERGAVIAEEDASGGLEYTVTDETEYQEMPGALGVAFDFKTAIEKGPDEALKKTATSLVESILTFKDLSAKAEVKEFWEPLLNPGDDVYEELSLSSEIYREQYKRSRLYDTFANTPVVGEALPNPVDLDYSAINKLRDSIRDFPVWGASLRDVKFGGVKSGTVSALKQVIENNPEVISGNSEDLTEIYNRVIPDFERIEWLDKRANELKGERDLSVGNILLPPDIFRRKTMKELWAVNKEKDELTDKIYFGVQNGGEYAKEIDKLTTHEDKDGNEIHMGRRIMGWAKIVSYRERVFYYNELIDTIAEGNIFKNMIWGDMVIPFIGKIALKEKFKYLRPDFYTQNILSYLVGFAKFEVDKDTKKWAFRTGLHLSGKVNEFYFGGIPIGGDRRIGIPTPAFIINKLIGPIDKWVNKFEAMLVNNRLARYAIIGWRGDIIKTVVSKVVQKAFVAMGATGVGVLPALVAATLTYVGEKVWNLTKSVFTLNFEKAYEDFVKEVTNLTKFFVTGVMIIAILIVGITQLVMAGVFGIMAGTTVEPTGRGGAIVDVGNTPGGAGLKCTDEVKGEIIYPYTLFTQISAIGVVDKSGGYHDNLDDQGGGYYRITSCFGDPRMGDDGKCYKHAGLDIVVINAADMLSQKLVSPFGYPNDEKARVYFAGDGGAFGNLVILEGLIDENDPDWGKDKEPDLKRSGVYYIYLAHLSNIYVSVGDVVDYQTVLGTLGSTGNSTGPHLHYEIRSGSKSADYVINPCTVLRCPQKSGGGSCGTDLHGN